MNKLIFIENICNGVSRNLRLYRYCATRNYCDNKFEEEKDSTAKINEKSNTSKQKLNSLLKAMLDDSAQRGKTDLQLAKPTKKKSKQRKANSNELDDSAKHLNQNIREATKNVAEHVGGNVQQTESELLSKLLLRKTDNEDSTSIGANSLSDLIVGMKIDRNKKAQNVVTSRAQYVRQTIAKTNNDGIKKFKGKRHTKNTSPKTGGRVELFGGVSLGIFINKEQLKKENLLSTMEVLKQRELKLAIMHPPENFFQKMILWTEQGKLWKFPIDNEQGLNEEQNVYFAEHVFLDHHLESWCPTKGPIRHFMELVCVGLSKNPYLTVQEKINHIKWFQDYFKEKQGLLKEVGAIQSDFAVKSSVKELEYRD